MEFKASFAGDSTLKFRWICEYQYAGVSTFTASDFLEDTSHFKTKLVMVPAADNRDEVTFFLEAYDTNDVVHCRDSIKLTFSKFSILPNQNSVEIMQGDTVKISTSTGGGVGLLSYSWSPNYNISDSTDAGPSVWPDTTMIYHCSIKDEHACYSSYNDYFEVIVKTVSIPKVEKQNVEVLIFPNPINEKTAVQILNVRDFSAYTYQLLDVKGRIIQSAPLDSEVNLGDLLSSSGIYFFTVLYKDEVVKVEKLVR